MNISEALLSAKIKADNSKPYIYNNKILPEVFFTDRKIIICKPAVSADELFSSLHIPTDAEDENTQTILRMLEEAETVASPKAVYRLCAVEDKGGDFVVANGIKIVSTLVRKNLENANRIVAYAATCGTELEEWSKRYKDPLESYWADAVKLLYLAAVRKELNAKVWEDYFHTDDMSAMSPGSLPSWPLPAQRTLFKLIGNTEKTIGVTLTDSCLMLPSKSVSGILFSDESHYENCRFCPILKCPGRRAPFKGEFHENI